MKKRHLAENVNIAYTSYETFIHLKGKTTIDIRIKDKM